MQDLAELQIELHDYARWQDHHKIMERTNSNDKTEAPSLSASAKELLREEDSLNDLINTLEKYKTSAPSIDITLAAPATGAIKKELVSWCRKNINPSVIVNFKFNATILGGMVIKYGSHIFDWSFKRQILAARNNFPEVLRRV